MIAEADTPKAAAVMRYGFMCSGIERVASSTDAPAARNSAFADDTTDEASDPPEELDEKGQTMIL
jgi:hypothetical protein